MFATLVMNMSMHAAIHKALWSRYVTKLEFELDNVRTSNVFNRFEIRRMF